VAAGIILVASIVVSRLSRGGGAPLIAAAVGSLLGGIVMYIERHYNMGSRTDPLALVVLGLVGLGAAICVLWTGRRPRLARLPRPMISLAIALLATFSAFLLGRIGFEEVAPEPPAEVARGADAPPPVVFIVLDTLRADHLPSYGYSRATMPELEAFFRRRGLPPLRSVANSPWSLPSHASMFTGLYPPNHGAHYTVVDDPDPPIDPHPLGDGTPTLAEILAAAGYWTVGISSNFGPLGPAYGLGRGFDSYNAMPNPVYMMKRLTPWRLPARERWPMEILDRVPPFSLSRAGFFGVEISYRQADWITDDAIRVVDAAGDRALFLFLNYLEPHSPFDPPEAFARRFEGVSSDLPVPALIRDYRDIVYKRKERATKKENDHLIALYDGELNFLDSQLARLFERLERHPRFDDMLIVVTSDHGESLGEHDHYGHGVSLYRELLEVPLFVKLRAGWSSAPPAGVVQSVDLFPLVLEHAGIEIPENIDAVRWGETRKEVLSWIYVFSAAVLSFDPSFERELRSIESAGYKLIESSNGSTELFEVEADLGELEDVSASESERLDAMHYLLGPRIGFEDRGKKELDPVDEVTLEQLRALGYLP
ncbi:MAG: sulfatase, partial [Planctomycetota bacterium]|nr:sulfatase [Planctomycetota bacterium]